MSEYKSTTVALYSTNTVISAIYCSPIHRISKDELPSFIQHLNSISCAKLDVISTGQSTYWPSDLKKRPVLIDYAATKNIRDIREQMSKFDLSSDHSSTIVTFKNIQLVTSPYYLPS